jgi:hypothetical protein
MKDPNELAQIQGEFVSRQAQIVGDQTKEFGRAIYERRQRNNRDHPRAHGKRGSQPTRSGMMREAHAGNA